ncbi:ribonuclease H-like domain-containing protein [Tanacetum coccineum]
MTDLGALNYFFGISADRTPTGLFLSQKKYALQLLECAHMVTCNPSLTPADTKSKLVHQICLYMHDPREPHFAALKSILRYVWGTVDFGLHLYVSATTSLVGYTDADWAGCLSTRSAEAEYWGVANFLRELHSPLMTATLVYFDNVSTVYMSANLVQHQRTKHIEIDIHFFRDMVTAGHVRVLHVPSRFQFADIFTKGLPSALFEDFRSSLSVRPPPALTAGADSYENGDYDEDPYDDDMYEGHDIPDKIQDICDNLDIRVRGRIFFFKFSYNTGMKSMLENGPWWIHNVALILRKWSLFANISKEDLKSVPVWVKLHDVPMTTFTKDGLSVIATKLGTH